MHLTTHKNSPRAVLKTEPVTGAIAIPFPNCVLLEDDWEEEKPTMLPHIGTRDSKTTNHNRDKTSDESKVLATTLGKVTVALQHTVGGPCDLCATTMMLIGKGGRLRIIWGE
eukprot:CAMPEP_0171316686 /NCGR_PEP_ID=MMETSP0816-20121228/75043_1 /TAXON_ID=420281 /ORGANISM="Proboscia inermis, Strain CCAP1064/1" /LENGTH=111 /DNA_ID=CAMNT_0011809051 /DNA_START=239 /DNA_END=571 /DNA_ORIENTATION=-